MSSDKLSFVCMVFGVVILFLLMNACASAPVVFTVEANAASGTHVFTIDGNGVTHEIQEGASGELTASASVAGIEIPQRLTVTHEGLQTGSPSETLGDVR